MICKTIEEAVEILDAKMAEKKEAVITVNVMPEVLMAGAVLQAVCKADPRLILSNIKVCLIPGEEMNAYCFGSRSIGVTEGALNLDNKTVEAIIAHEMGHLFNGDSILNMILVANCLGIIAILAFYQFALIAVVYIIMILCCVMGLFHFSFASYFVTSKISGVIRFVMEAAKTVVLQASRLVISALGRKSEFMADRFAAHMGYTFYLKRFLERFAPDRGSSEQSFFAVLYDTHPSTALRIQELNSIDEQRMLPGA